MESTCDQITFSKYSSSKYILHMECGKHFVINTETKQKIDNILNGNNEAHKTKLIERLRTKKNKLNDGMFLASFQFKIDLISEKWIKTLSQPFVFLFNKNIMVTVVFFTLITNIYYFFVNIPQNQEIQLKASWLILFAVFFFHEMGHAAACLKYKVKPVKIGFGMTSFLPVLYADVSDAWRLGSKERMVVNFGGIYFQVIMATLLLFVGLNTAYTEYYFIGKTLFIGSFFNLFPFYKSDGYWILSDMVKMPNLFPNSRKILLEKIRNISKKCTGKEFLVIMYYLLITFFILFFLVRTGIRLKEYVINLPFYLWETLSNLFKLEFNRIHFHADYLWTIIYIAFVIRFVINNVKYFLSNGADGKGK